MTGFEYCRTCDKFEVCKFSSKLAEYVDDSNELLTNADLQEIITNDIRCKHYNKKVEVIRGTNGNLVGKLIGYTNYK